MNFKNFKSQVFAKQPDVRQGYDALSTQDESHHAKNKRAESMGKPTQENTSDPVNRGCCGG